MIFNSFHFLVVFPLMFLLYYLIPAKLLKCRNGYLLAVSYLLYANWKPSYALILLGVTAVSFLVARRIERTTERKKQFIWGG